MRILGIERNNFATNHYRVVQPLRKLQQHRLAETSTFHIDDLKTRLEQITELVIGADVILTYSPSNEDWLGFMKLCRKHGKLVVADYDDDPFNVSPWNPAYQHVGMQEVAYEWPDGTRDLLWSEDMVGAKGEPGFFDVERNLRTRDLFAVNFKRADLVTTTTDILAETLRAFNPRVGILPNLIDLEDYVRLDVNRRGRVRIGWQGGSSHYEDLWVMLDSLRRLLEKYPHVTFVYLGDLRLAGVLRPLPPAQVEIHRWVSHAAYSYKLATLCLDIGLCPLVDTVFNMNKSAIKWMEYSAVGAATIASGITPYRQVIEHDQTGLLAGDDAWFMAMESLVLDEKRRRKLADNAYDAVESSHNSDTKAHLWVEAYEQLLKQPLMVS